jgi:hypothetical protein
MGVLRPLAIAQDYVGLHAAFRQYVEMINVSRETIDDSAGWADGYASKALAPFPMRMLGRETLGPFLQGTGLVLIVAQDIDAFNRRRARLPERQENQVRLGNKSRVEKAATKAKRKSATKRREGKYA